MRKYKWDLQKDWLGIEVQAYQTFSAGKVKVTGVGFTPTDSLAEQHNSGMERGFGSSPVWSPSALALGLEVKSS